MSLSVPEVVKHLLEQSAEAMNLAKGGVTIGPADEDQIQNFVIEVAERGFIKPELYVPLARARVNITILGPSLNTVEMIKSIVFDDFNYSLKAEQRRVIKQDSGESFLVHTTWVHGGPVQGPVQEIHSYQQERLTIGALIGTQPIPPD